MTLISLLLYFLAHKYPKPLAFQGSRFEMVLPLFAANLGVSAFGLLCIGQNKPGSVTVPLKPKWLKNPLIWCCSEGCP